MTYLAVTYSAFWVFIGLAETQLGNKPFELPKRFAGFDLHVVQRHDGLLMSVVYSLAIFEFLVKNRVLTWNGRFPPELAVVTPLDSLEIGIFLGIRPPLEPPW